MRSARGLNIALLLITISGSWATSATAISGLPDLRAGDIILLSLKCYICSAISTTTGSPFNHSGLVIDVAEPGAAAADSTRVAQSLTETETIPLSSFLQQAPKNSTIAILRPQELATSYHQDAREYAAAIQRMRRFFTTQMLGRPFDDDYLWDNVDDQGREILYCSEMVQKTLNQALKQKMNPVALDYSRLWDFWSNYFDGHVPQGEAGNSPGSLARAAELTTLYVGLRPD